MNAVTEFEVGQKYSNDQIRFSLGVENLGGIRPSLDETGCLRHVAILTTSSLTKSNKADNPYHDRVEGDVLIYTAAGRRGDQVLSGRNKRILEQYNSPIPFYGFMNHGQQIYEFLGMLEIVRHYPEHQVDQQKNLRMVWVFEFRIHRKPPIVPLEISREITATILAQSKRQGLSLETDREIIANQSLDEKEEVSIEETRSKLLDLNPYRFEHLIKAVLEKEGFNGVEVTKSSGDGGIDLNATVSDSHLFFAGSPVQFQAKRWRHAVGSIEVNSFRGAMNNNAKGVFITTSYFTRAAIENAYNQSKSIITLVDGVKFSSIVLRSGVIVQQFT